MDVFDHDSLPLPVQRAIEARNAAMKPLLTTIYSLDVSWIIVQGNFGDLLHTIDVFAGDDHARTIALLREPLAKHRYQLKIVRTFHNFLSSAVAHLSQIDKAMRKCAPIAGAAAREWLQREQTVRHRLRFLEHLRDFSIHAGVHQPALTLTFKESGEPLGKVGLSIEAVLAYLQDKRPRQKERLSLRASISRLKAVTSATIEIRPIVMDYYEETDAHHAWFRKALVSLYERVSNDLARWAPVADRATIEQFFNDNPLSVHGDSEAKRAAGTELHQSAMRSSNESRGLGQPISSRR